MQKGHYKCLFCDSILCLQCGCADKDAEVPTDTTNSSNMYVCDNGHVVKIIATGSNKCIGCCDDFVMEEGYRTFHGLKREYTFPGKQNRFPLWDYDVWTYWFSNEMFWEWTPFEIDCFMELYNAQQSQLQEEAKETRAAWLGCWSNMGSTFINKDVALKISDMLQWEPFVFVKEDRASKKLKSKK